MAGGYSLTAIAKELGITRERVRQLVHKTGVYEVYLQNRKQHYSLVFPELRRCLRCRTMFSMEGRGPRTNGDYHGTKYCSRDCYREKLKAYRRAQVRRVYHGNILGYRDKMRVRNRSHPQHTWNGAWFPQEDGWLEYKEVKESHVRRVAGSSNSSSDQQP